MNISLERRLEGALKSQEMAREARRSRWDDIDVLLSRSSDIQTIVDKIGVSANTLSRQASRAWKTAETVAEQEYWRKRTNVFARYDKRQRDALKRAA